MNYNDDCRLNLIVRHITGEEVVHIRINRNINVSVLKEEISRRHDNVPINNITLRLNGIVLAEDSSLRELQSESNIFVTIDKLYITEVYLENTRRISNYETDLRNFINGILGIGIVGIGIVGIRILRPYFFKPNKK